MCDREHSMALSPFPSVCFRTKDASFSTRSEEDKASTEPRGSTEPRASASGHSPNRAREQADSRKRTPKGATMKPRQFTEKQREAAKKNGARSSGPVTARGKYNSSRNSARHNLLAQTVVLEAEAPDRFLALMDALKEEHQPRTTTEVLLVESMAIARWRLTRVWGAQKTAMDRDMAQLDPNVGPAAVRVVLSMRPSTEVPVELLLRYEAMFERQFSRALRSLNQSKARRTGYETEPYFPQAPSAGTLKEETATAKRSPEVIEITSPGLDLPPARESKSLPRIKPRETG
jgi:hypothetical protein